MRLRLADKAHIIGRDLIHVAAGQRTRIAGIKQLNAKKWPIRSNPSREIVIEHRIVDGDNWRLVAARLNLDGIG